MMTVSFYSEKWIKYPPGCSIVHQRCEKTSSTSKPSFSLSLCSTRTIDGEDSDASRLIDKLDRYLVSPGLNRHFHHLYPQNHYHRLLSKRQESLVRVQSILLVSHTLRTKPLVSGRWSWGCSSSLCRYSSSSSSSSLSIDGDSKCCGRLVKSKASGSCLIVYIVRWSWKTRGEEMTLYRCECLRSMNDVRDRCSQPTRMKENEEEKRDNWSKFKLTNGSLWVQRRERRRTVIARTSIPSWLCLPSLGESRLTEICKKQLMRRMKKTKHSSSLDG